MNEVSKNDIAVQLLLTIQEDSATLDISGATSKSIVVKKPSGESNTYTASFYTDGSDGKIYYNTVSGDLDEVGLYKVQALVVLSGGTYRSDIKKFRVRDNI